MSREKQLAYHRLPKNRERYRRNNRRYNLNLKAAVHAYLGNKCANLDCRWLNEDGTLGCTDSDILQIDHVYNDGAEDRRKFDGKIQKLYQFILTDTSGHYQLLCANCNWKKRQLDIRSKWI